MKDKKDVDEGEYVIFSVYDSENNLLGYKADSFWSLAEKEIAKVHPANQALVSSNVLHNLLYFCSKDFSHSEKSIYKEYVIDEGAKLDERGKLEIAVEDFKTGKEIFRYTLTQDGFGRYDIVDFK